MGKTACRSTREFAYFAGCPRIREVAIGRQRDGAGGRQARPGRVAAPSFELDQALRSSARRLNRHIFSRALHAVLRDT